MQLRPALVTRMLSVEDSTLIMCDVCHEWSTCRCCHWAACSLDVLIAARCACREFAAADARTLRSAVGTFCDLLALATRTLETFTKVTR